MHTETHTPEANAETPRKLSTAEVCELLRLSSLVSRACARMVRARTLLAIREHELEEARAVLLRAHAEIHGTHPKNH